MLPGDGGDFDADAAQACQDGPGGVRGRAWNNAVERALPGPEPELPEALAEPVGADRAALGEQLRGQARDYLGLQPGPGHKAAQGPQPGDRPGVASLLTNVASCILNMTWTENSPNGSDTSTNIMERRICLAAAG